MIAATTLQELSIQFDPVGSWWLTGLVAAALLAVLLAVPPDRSRVGGWQRGVLVALRFAAFLALVACMLRPTLVATRKARQHGTIILLADGSRSMTVTDGPNGRSRWQEVRDALAAAAPAARDLVASGDFDIVPWRFDREAHAVPPRGDDPFPFGDWVEAASADETAIGAALEDAVRAAAGRTIAGVVVLSDGAQHAYAPRDIPPQAAARKLGDLGAPVWSVTFGQQRGEGQGRDAAIVNLAAADKVYVKNSLEVSGRVRLEGFAGREVAVRLLAEDAEGRMERVAATTVRADGDTAEQAIRLAWTPTAVGERKVTLLVEPQDGEVIVANNELSTFVDVVDGGLRILYLEGALRVEQRFLRRVLAASPDMQVDFEWIDASRRERWPVTLGRLLAGEHDVYLIGDLDASAIAADDLRTIMGRVNAGAGLAFLGGFHAFEAGGWASSALGPLAPFVPDRLARQPFDEPVREGLHLPGPLRMLPDPRFGGVSILRLGASEADSRAVWESLPPLDGATVLGGLVPAAKPLAVTADGRPLLVAREFGAGRVAAFAADSTWRWAMQGAAEQHRRFWRQFVLWLARQDDAEEDSLWVRPAQRRISPGTPLEFDAGLTRPDGTAQADVVMEAVVVTPQGQRRPVRATKRGDTFFGVVEDCNEPGDWTLVVRGRHAQDAAFRERAARFTVFRQDLELANPRSNPLLMRQLTEGTGGGARLPEELPTIFREIAERPAAFETDEQWSATPWDSWPMLLVMAGCLCAEWVARKRFGLV